MLIVNISRMLYFAVIISIIFIITLNVMCLVILHLSGACQWTTNLLNLLILLVIKQRRIHSTKFTSGKTLI